MCCMRQGPRLQHILQAVLVLIIREEAHARAHVPVGPLRRPVVLPPACVRGAASTGHAKLRGAGYSAGSAAQHKTQRAVRRPRCAA